MSVLVDAKLLLYALLEDVPEHEPARDWLLQTLDDPDSSVALSGPVLYAVARLLSSRAVMGAALGVPLAWSMADAFRRQPAVRMLDPGPRHATLVSTLAATPGLTSRDVPDLHLAALAVENGLVLATHDRGFARFGMLRWLDPITGDSSTP